MGKRIVYCADGTWQTPLNGTNVYRIFKALTVTSEQITFYDDGVGANVSGIDHLLGGTTGEGLLQKVTDAYTQIAHVYEAGDEIFLFGFSRGAYTVRSLGGFIANCGLPTGKFDDSCVTQAFSAYRDPADRAEILSGLDACGLGDAVIRMIGVWDTVGALGIPALVGGIDDKRYGFLDTSLHSDVKNAYQCLAIDEQRRQFPATLWTSAPAPGQTIEQVWFTGCHSDVGGGTPLAGGVDGDTRLCDITLAWMISKAIPLGLTFDPAVIQQYGMPAAKYALDKYTDSWMGMPLGAPVRRTIAPDATLGNSVALRIKYGAGSYLPTNLTINNGILSDTYKFATVVEGA